MDSLKKEAKGTSALKKKALTMAAIILLIILTAVIYGQWNNLFYEFGRNLYHLFH